MRFYITFAKRYLTLRINCHHSYTFFNSDVQSDVEKSGAGSHTSVQMAPLVTRKTFVLTDLISRFFLFWLKKRKKLTFYDQVGSSIIIIVLHKKTCASDLASDIYRNNFETAISKDEKATLVTYEEIFWTKKVMPYLKNLKASSEHAHT